ncbi:MAG TPA: 3'-5' exonuclease [Bacteroidia bacterium]|nr:3'-5' exonuclease [Bacteroidia bacterium]
MYNQLNLENVLFLDIETVPMFPTYADVPENWRALWDKKANTLKMEEEENPASIYSRAGIYAEFGKIICISVGFLKYADGKETFRMKSFSGDDEQQLLSEFGDLLRKHFNRDIHRICGHNVKEFDIPYIARRMIINGVHLPSMLDLAGKKPWEILHLDTMEMWKFGDFKSYTSLVLLATALGIPTPKDDIDGSMVHSVYYQEKNLARIVTYCQKDVLTVAQILKKFRNEPLINGANVMIS